MNNTKPTSMRRDIGALFAASILCCAGLGVVQAQAADLAVTVTGPTSVAAGATATFALHATNVGPLPLHGGIPTTVTNHVPAVFGQFLLSNAPGWDCSASSGSFLSCLSTVALTAGQALPVISYSVHANSAGAFSNCADISFVANAATQPDQVLANNHSCVNGAVGSGGGGTAGGGTAGGGTAGGGTVGGGIYQQKGEAQHFPNAQVVNPGVVGPGEGRGITTAPTSKKGAR